MLRKVALRRKTGLARKTPFAHAGSLSRANSTLKRTPLKKESTEHERGRKDFHDACFAIHGDRCFFCGGPARDAMHIIPRRILSAEQRYARADVNSRPGCRGCHQLQEDGLKSFPPKVVEAARAVLALLGKSAVPLPKRPSDQPTSIAPTSSS